MILFFCVVCFGHGQRLLMLMLVPSASFGIVLFHREDEDLKVSFYTLGCRLNQCESEALAQAFEKAGFTVPSSSEPSRIHIVNTCTVTSKAEQKARRMIRLFAEQEATDVVIVTGCYAQLNQTELEALSPKVVVVGGLVKSRLLDLPSIISGSAEKDLLTLCRRFAEGMETPGIVENPFGFDATKFTFHSRAYLKVQDGCDNNCYYCRVHIARGPSVSLPVETAVSRALELEALGYHEIVLTGVNLTMYNHSSDGIGGLLEALLNVLRDDTRIRFSSLEPDHVDDRFLSLISDHRVQPHFHIPIQSASDSVLRRVNRSYNSAELVDIIGRIRQARPGAFLACDVIAGLPGEGDAEFSQTYDFIRDNGFAQLHVFPFSPRPGTMLFGAKDRPCEQVRDDRAKLLRELSDELHRKYIRRQSQMPVELLLEKKVGSYWNALSGNYIKTRIEDRPGFSRGDIVQARFPVLDGSEDDITVDSLC
jgi:threonylcarbamoyladenosine tRNA methylthiotransferase MtaB